MLIFIQKFVILANIVFNTNRKVYNSLMKKNYKRLAIVTLTGILLGTAPVSFSFAKEADSIEEVTIDESDVQESLINYTEELLTITKDKFTADSFNGVDALYRRGSGDGNNATYSCAAFIKKYYKEVYGVSVKNLYSNSTPSSSEGKFKSVKKPQVGDIVACSTNSGSNHWAIVKKVNDDNTVTLIEQNWKWSQGGQTVCKINRTLSISKAKFYRLYS